MSCWYKSSVDNLKRSLGDHQHLEANWGELNTQSTTTCQSHNHYDHSEGIAHVCIVYRDDDMLCSASATISGDAAEGGGGQGSPICTVLTLSSICTGRSGVRTQAQVYMWSSDNGEPEHIVWLKIALTSGKNICSICICM